MLDRSSSGPQVAEQTPGFEVLDIETRDVGDRCSTVSTDERHQRRSGDDSVA